MSDGGWTWAFKAAAVLNGMTLLLMIFCMPETIHPRGGNRLPYSTNFDWYDRFVRIRRRRQDRLDLWTILRPLQMSLYPSVFFPSLLTAITNALGCLGIALIVPSFFAKIYGFDLKASGETNIAFIIGGFLGEIFAGKWSDYLIIRLARNRGGEHIPELRLHALWPAVILIPVSTSNVRDTYATKVTNRSIKRVDFSFSEFVCISNLPGLDQSWVAPSRFLVIRSSSQLLPPTASIATDRSPDMSVHGSTAFDRV